MSTRRVTTLTVLGGLCLSASAAHAKITFDFDYSLDGPTGFFAQNPAAKTALDQAASVYTDRILDTLAPITPDSNNTWTTSFVNPATGVKDSPTFKDLAIPANTLKVFIGAHSLGGPLGLGGPGGFQATTSTFAPTVNFRGQTGASLTPPTDFGGRWGGTIAFDSTANWNFDLVGPHTGQQDFLSVATHELAHVLGFGTAGSWTQNYASGGFFNGPKAVALYGGPVPLNSGGDHFNNGVLSTAGGVPQETLMDPDITTGTRKYITLLDFAALDDLGWDLARPGDANADGTVNFADLLTLAKNYNTQTRRWAQGDFNYDGTVNFADLLALAKNYNQSGPQPADLPAGTSPDFAAAWTAAQAEAAVPEPASMATLLLAAIPLLTARRRRRS
jgi:hypothetical protein